MLFVFYGHGEDFADVQHTDNPVINSNRFVEEKVRKVHVYIENGDFEAFTDFLDRYPEYIYSYFGSNPITLLQRAVRRGRIDFVEELLRRGADPHERTREEGKTLLHISYHSEVTQKLIDMKIFDINAPDGQGLTPLHTQASSQYLNASNIKILLAAGADPNIPNENKFLPSHIIYNKPHRPPSLLERLSVLNVLLEYDADVNARTNKGVSVLHLVSKINDVEAIRVISRRNGVIINIQDELGRNPLTYAYYGRAREAFDELLWLGAQPFLENRRAGSIMSMAYRDKDKYLFAREVLEKLKKYFENKCRYAVSSPSAS